MKKTLTLITMLLCLLTAQAQNEVTTFLGIPIDGFKSEMRKKLIAKGFTPVTGDEILEGEFNGTDVYIGIATNNNKVYRITVHDKKSRDEGDIKIRFNKLVSQFENNKRYTALKSYTLSDSEDISYEMTVNNKKYDAVFFQNISSTDSSTILRNCMAEILEKHPEELDKQYEHLSKEVKLEIEKTFLNKIWEAMYNRQTWFRIMQNKYGYSIMMFYDNKYNEANGEDL